MLLADDARGSQVPSPHLHAGTVCYMFQFIAAVATEDGLRATSAKISPDGRFLAITQGLNILIYDVSKRAISQTLVTSHARPFSELCWSPDGQCIATASDDFSVEIVHLSYGLLHTFVGHTAPVISLAFNRKGNLLFTSSMDESIKIWDTLNGSLMKTISAHSEAVRVGGCAHELTRPF